MKHKTFILPLLLLVTACNDPQLQKKNLELKNSKLELEQKVTDLQLELKQTQESKKAEPAKLSPKAEGPLLASDAQTKTFAQGKHYAPLSAYERNELEGWNLLVAKELKKSGLWPQVRQEAQLQLFRIKKVLPSKVLKAMQQTPIFFELKRGKDPCACYHPSKKWLGENGYNPAKAKSVDICGAKNFINWTKKQPNMMLHELAHAYHDQVLDFANAEIMQLFMAAKDKGQYEKVLNISGKTVRAYAAGNPQEYFAEALEAYYGVNDYYPFVRAELKTHDLGIYKWIEKNLEKKR